MTATLGLRRAVPWFGAGTIFGLFGSQLIKDLLVVEDGKKPGTGVNSSVQVDGATSPHYPPDFSLPSSNNIVVTSAFTSSQNFRTKTPDWVAELLTYELVNSKNGDRRNSQFKSEKNLPDNFRATNADYWDSGWSRGHLAAAASHRQSQEGQDSTFLLNTNIVPQDLSMNGCDWNRLEVLVRDVTKSFPSGKVFVLSGPVWVPESNTSFTQRPFSKNKVIMYEVLGKSNVHVPTHMFKIIRVQDESKNVDASVAFVMPNRPINQESPTESYIYDLDELEKMTGLNLSGMKSSANLCTIVKCEKTTNRRMLGWRHYGHIDEARDIEQLRIAVRNALRDGFVDGDNFLIGKIVRDRMHDLKLGDDVSRLFPDDEDLQQAVRRGIEKFTKRSAPKIEED